MHLHLQVKHWVVVWFWIGIVCGIVALVNIFVRKMSPEDIKLSLFFGIDFWIIGGLVCYGFEGVRIEPPPVRRRQKQRPGAPPVKEWHSASDFLIPGDHKHLLP